MEKLNLDDPATKSADIVAENIEALSALFPEAFKEGRIDFDVLNPHSPSKSLISLS